MTKALTVTGAATTITLSALLCWVWWLGIHAALAGLWPAWQAGLACAMALGPAAGVAATWPRRDHASPIPIQWRPRTLANGVFLGLTIATLLLALTYGMNAQFPLWAASLVLVSVVVLDAKITAWYIARTPKTGYEPQPPDAQALPLMQVAPKSQGPPAGVEFVRNPETHFRDVIGLEDAKREVSDAIRLMERPDTAKLHGLKPRRGLLLVGPPGTGKTLFARATAGEFKRNFISVNAAELKSKWVGDTEKNIKAVFEFARSMYPCIMFIDEADSLMRDRSLSQNSWEADAVNYLLQEMDGIQGKERAPIVLAATNNESVLDPAVLRPGRFDRIVRIELPDQADRVALLQFYLRSRQLSPDVDLVAVAAAGEGLSPAELQAVTADAALRIYREDPDSAPRAIRQADLLASLNH